MNTFLIEDLQALKSFNVYNLILSLRSQGFKSYTVGNFKILSEANQEVVINTINSLN